MAAMPLKKQILDQYHYYREMVFENYKYVSDSRKEIDQVNLSEEKKELESYFNGMQEAQKDLRDLTELINEANNNTMIKTSQGEMSIAKGLSFAKQLRDVAYIYDLLSKQKDFEITTEYGSSVVMYKKSVLDPRECREKSVSIKKEAQNVSAQIEKVNGETEIIAHMAEKYL